MTGISGLFRCRHTLITLSLSQSIELVLFTFFFWCDAVIRNRDTVMEVMAVFPLLDFPILGHAVQQLPGVCR